MHLIFIHLNKFEKCSIILFSDEVIDETYGVAVQFDEDEEVLLLYGISTLYKPLSC